jgi:hypothetical protein
LTSIRWEKAASRRRVRTWVKAGESMRSEVSSMRWRREEVVVGEGGGEVVIPDSERTYDS